MLSLSFEFTHLSVQNGREPDRRDSWRPNWGVGGRIEHVPLHTEELHFSSYGWSHGFRMQTTSSRILITQSVRKRWNASSRMRMEKQSVCKLWRWTNHPSVSWLYDIHIQISWYIGTQRSTTLNWPFVTSFSDRFPRERIGFRGMCAKGDKPKDIYLEEVCTPVWGRKAASG